MLRPNKHSHPDQTVLAAATILLRELRAKRAVSYDDLKSTLAKASRSANYLFIPAVSLLHILGLVDYRSSSDSFEYRGS
jgi:hypothetical protein